MIKRFNGTSWVVVGNLDDILPIQTIWPAGSVRVTISGVADLGWLLFGQTVLLAQTLYPALWEVAPTVWKSGVDLIIPSDVDCGLRGSSIAGLGQVSGTNVKTIATANLPVHGHTVNIGSGNDGPDHSHGVNNSDGQSGAHYHDNQGSGPYVFWGDWPGGGGYGFAAGFDYIFSYSGTTNYGSHDHIHGHSGGTGGRYQYHQHAVDGNTGNVGSGTALNVQDAAINVRFQIKAH